MPPAGGDRDQPALLKLSADIEPLVAGSDRLGVRQRPHLKKWTSPPRVAIISKYQIPVPALMRCARPG